MDVLTSVPKVSIIMPTHNRAGLILETVETVRNQGYPHWELVIIDDQSTDNTAGLIEQLQDKRIVLYKTGTRLGITGSRNEGLRKAKGELIAFIDSDDLWDPSKLGKQVTALQQYPEAKFSLTGGYNFRKQGEAVAYFYKQREGFTCGDLFIPFFRSEIAAITPSLLFRKDCLVTTGLLNEEKYFAETDFMLQLAKNFTGIVLYEPLLFRRLHKENISAAKWEQGYKEGVELIRAFRLSLPPGLARNALFRLHINTGEKYLSFRQRNKAVRHFLMAWKSKPLSFVPLKKTVKALLKRLEK